MAKVMLNLTDETKAVLHNYRIMHRMKNISLTVEAIIAEWEQCKNINTRKECPICKGTGKSEEGLLYDNLDPHIARCVWCNGTGVINGEAPLKTANERGDIILIETARDVCDRRNLSTNVCDTARHNNTIPDSIESATNEQQET
jgi:RecJ-like exonuclease